jgi:regulator of cell morphogenesis and NO signaling
MTDAQTLTMTIGQIVAADYRAAGVFERHGIDFCCRGARTLERACEDAGIESAQVVRDLSGITSPVADDAPRFDAWELPNLVEHIVSKHHAYVRATLPLLIEHSRKIAAVHGRAHRELPQVAQLVRQVAAEMDTHMLTEEEILFPYIVQLALAITDRAAPTHAGFGTVANPIHRMETEHESAGTAMAEIRELTNGFSVPDDACRTYSVCLQELEAFERDLHAHVHLENNILFPKAVALEASIR